MRYNAVVRIGSMTRHLINLLAPLNRALPVPTWLPVLGRVGECLILTGFCGFSLWMTIRFTSLDRWLASLGQPIPHFWLFKWAFGVASILSGTGAARILAGLLRGRRPNDPRLCGRCGYDLTGNVSGVCPECGAAVIGARSEATASPSPHQP